MKKREARILKMRVIAALAGGLLLYAACPTHVDEPEEEPGNEEPNNPTTRFYTVTFSVGAGSGTAPAQQMHKSGTVITLPKQGEMIAPEDYTFEGWETDNLVYEAEASFTVTKSTAFVAQWRSPIDPDKTYVEFNNLEQFTAIMYSDSSRQTELIRVPGNGKKLLETEPKPQGTVFYPRFLLEFEDVPLSYDGTSVMIRVDEKTVNKANIPKLISIETGSAFVKIENKSTYSLTFNQGSYELSPLEAASNIVMPGENGAYRIEPGAVSQYRAMRNGSIPIAFPTSLLQFEAEMLYIFSYTGSALTLSSPKPLMEALTLLPAPGPVGVNVVSPNSISLTWTAVESATSYKVYRASALDGEYAFLETVSASPYTGENLSVGTSYFYKVQAVNAERESPLSAARAILILPSVQDITAQVEEAAHITLSWAAVPGASEYKVYRSSDPDAEYEAIETVSSFTYTDESPSAGTQYSYKIRALDTQTAGVSLLSTAVTARILGSPQQLSAQVAPASSITLSWAEVEEASTYKVYRSSSPDTGYELIETVNVLTYTDQDLSVGTSYYYKLQGANSQGDGILSAAVPVKILPTPQVQAQASNTQMAITLSWAEVPGAGLYQVYRSTTSGTGFAAIGTASGLSYTDENLSGGTTYYYTIQALHTAESGTSPFSAQVSAPILAPPQQLSAQVASVSSITLSWAAVEGASMYKVYRSSSPDTGFTLIETLSERTYTNQGLSVGTNYYYKLQGANSQGDGVLSAAVPVKILPTPQQVQAQASSTETAITLSWGTAAGATFYQVYRSTTADTGFVSIGTASGLSYTDGNLSQGTTYYYKIKALHTVESGTSPFSAQVSATTPVLPGISGLTYSSVSGGTWTIQSDGSRKSPATAHGGMTKARVSFTSGSANQSITIQLRVSAYGGPYYSSNDYAFISTLDNASATASSGYYSGSRISGEQSVSITIPVPTAGSHFIDIGYQKDGSISSGSDCAWFTVTDY